MPQLSPGAGKVAKMRWEETDGKSFMEEKSLSGRAAPARPPGRPACRSPLRLPFVLFVVNFCLIPPVMRKNPTRGCSGVFWRVPSARWALLGRLISIAGQEGLKTAEIDFPKRKTWIPVFTGMTDCETLARSAGEGRVRV